MANTTDQSSDPPDESWRLRLSLRGVAAALIIYAIYAVLWGPGPEKSFAAGISAAMILFSLWYAVDAWRADRPEDVGMPQSERDRLAQERNEPESDGEPTA